MVILASACISINKYNLLLSYGQFPTFSYFEMICCFLCLGNCEVSETKSVCAASQDMNPALSLFRTGQEFYFRVLVSVARDSHQYQGSRGGTLSCNRKVSTAAEPTYSTLRRLDFQSNH